MSKNKSEEVIKLDYLPMEKSDIAPMERGLNSSEQKELNLTGYDKIINSLREIYIKKNKDYGNSFDDQLTEFGPVVAAIMLDIKVRRLKSLIKNKKANVESESLMDTAMDTANYAIMLAKWLSENGEENIGNCLEKLKLTCHLGEDILS